MIIQNVIDLSNLQNSMFFFCLNDFTVLNKSAMCNFGRYHFEEYLYELIFNLDQRFRWKRRLKVYALALVAIMISGTDCALLVEGII